MHPPIEANPPGLELAATWASAGLQIEATNGRARHKLPTGDPERWVQIDATFRDADGGLLGGAESSASSEARP